MSMNTAALRLLVVALVAPAFACASMQPIRVSAPPARLSITTEPAGAQVTIDGVYRGQTPLDVALAVETPPRGGPVRKSAVFKKPRPRGAADRDGDLDQDASDDG